MYCSKCGKEVSDNANFCFLCGTKILHHITTDNQDEQSEKVMCEPETAVPETGGEITAVKAMNEAVVENNAESVAVPYCFGVQAEQADGSSKKKGNKTAIIVIASIVVAVVFVSSIIGGVYHIVGTNKLKKELLRDWTRVEGSAGSYYTLELDFSEDRIEYNFDSGFAFLDSTLATYDYKVVSPNKIKVEYGLVEVEIKVEFDDDKEMMTFTPALTSPDKEENWFHFDE